MAEATGAARKVEQNVVKVKPRAGYALLVVGDSAGRVGALAGRVASVAARARVHGGANRSPCV